jgi:hypothetical protein
MRNYRPDRHGSSTTGRRGTCSAALGIGGTLGPPESAADRTKWARTTNSLYGLRPGRPSGDFPPGPHWDGPLGKVILHSTRQAARSFGGAGLSSGSVRWRTQKRTEAGGPSGATGRDPNCIVSMQPYYLRNWGLAPVRELVSFEMLLRAIHICR